MKEKCIFCKIAKKEIPAEIVGESDSFIAFRDIHPVTLGHTIVIPKEHYEDLIEMPDKLGQELLAFVKEVAEKVIDENSANGFNILMNNSESAGQVVMHAHLHIIPRRKGDNLRMIC